MRKAKSASAEQGGLNRAAVDWKYAQFYGLFFVCLLLIALFGMFAET